MRTLIAIPCLDTVCTEFLSSILNLQCVGDVGFKITQATLIYEARNLLSQQAVREGYDRIMWLDSDMVFHPDVMARLSKDMDEGREFVSGIYFGRNEPIRCTIFKNVEYRPVEDGDGEVLPVAEAYEDYPKDSIFEIGAAGFGCCMVTTRMVDRVAQKYGLPFSPLIGFGEDLSFCKRATELGAKLYCDSRIKLGHVKHTLVTEDDWTSR